MGSKDKLIDRFCRLPKDFTYEETLKLLSAFHRYSQAPSRKHNEGVDDENYFSAFKE